MTNSDPCLCLCHQSIATNGKPCYICKCNRDLQHEYYKNLEFSVLDLRNYCYEHLINRIKKLEEHHNYQIDENRKISRRVDELENKIKELEENEALVIDAIILTRKILEKIFDAFNKLT